MHEELLMIALVLAAALVGGSIAARIGYPRILGEIISGIILGPPILGLLSGNEAIAILGEVGVILMMLYIGMHLDLKDLKRASMPGFLAAAGGFLVPTALGFGLMVWDGRSLLEALFVGLAMGVTSLATKSRILVDLKILDTRIAHVLVAAALLSDVAVLVVFAAVVGPEGSDGATLGAAAMAGLGAIAFALGAWLIGSWVLPQIKKLIGDRSINRDVALLGIIVMGFTFAWAAELVGIHAILGAFIAGLFIDEGFIDPKLSRAVQEKLATISIGVLAPFFFVSAGFQVSLDVFRTDLFLLVAVVVLATLGKIIGTALFYLPSGNGWREGVVIGSGMNGRGAVEIIVAEIALVRGLIDQNSFSILVFMALFTTATVPVLLTMGVRWLRGRGELVKAGDRDTAVIVGAGAIARAIARTLQKTMPVVMVDTNRANQMAGRREGLEVFPGSGLDELAMEQAGIDKAIMVVAATPNAEVNVLTAQQALDEGVPDVAVMLRESDIQALRGRLADSGISIIRAPEDIVGWEHAVSSGRAGPESVAVGDTADDADSFRTANADDFPIVAVNSYERALFTLDTQLGPDDTVVVLRQSGLRTTDPAEREPAASEPGSD